MKKRLVIIVLAGYFIFPALGQHPPQDKNWEVVFQDDFSSFTHGQRWYVSNGIRTENEPQHYLPDNVNIVNGELVLTAKKENYHCTRPNCNCGGGTYNYTSGKIVSYNNSKLYHYGYYEMYAKLPVGLGLFPAFWLWSEEYSGPDCVWYNEIDIMEAGGCNSTITTTNYREFCKSLEHPNKVAVPHPCNYANSFHWYGVEWDQDKITWYIDRKVVRQVRHTGMQHRMQIIINLALFPSWSDCQADGSPLFVHMYIDTVNAYQLKYDCKKVVNEIDFATWTDDDYRVKKSITMSSVTSVTIPPGSNIYLRATDFIELNNGFEVPSGTELYLDINPCDITARVQKKLEE